LREPTNRNDRPALDFSGLNQLRSIEPLWRAATGDQTLEVAGAYREAAGKTIALSGDFRHRIDVSEAICTLSDDVGTVDAIDTVTRLGPMDRCSSPIPSISTPACRPCGYLHDDRTGHPVPVR
jgi:hypothetical protein